MLFTQIRDLLDCYDLDSVFLDTVEVWVGGYARLMGHICDSEPPRGSTGVFESGSAPYERLPDTPTYTPTFALSMVRCKAHRPRSTR